jgi:hypothetical protein
MKKLLFPLLLILPACQLVTGGDTERRLGTIDFYSDPVRVSVPDTVFAGVAFNVGVVTYGGGCVTRGDTEAWVNGMESQVTVYDNERSGGGVCTDELRMLEHTASLQFAQPGTATVRVRGWKEPEREEVTVTRTILVMAH